MNKVQGADRPLPRTGPGECARSCRFRALCDAACESRHSTAGRPSLITAPTNRHFAVGERRQEL